MTQTDPIGAYIVEITSQLKSGYAGEHGYRPALATLMGSFADVSATNDPRRTEHGNPDMVFYKTSNHAMILGRAEAKDISVNLDKTAKTEQLRRYAGYEKLFLTNGLDFIFYQNGEEYERVSIGKLAGQTIIFNESQFDRLNRELENFLTLKPESIKSGKRLAIIMGGKARRIRDNVNIYLNQEDTDRNQELTKIFNMMKTLLVHDLTSEKFADMYAQTLVYGLFVARYNDKTPGNFTRNEARDLVPASNPFLREFFDHIVGPRFDSRLSHIVDELCEVFSVSDVNKLIQKHLRLFEVENDKDPIIHFYEDFLKEYDPSERKRMGAYYTPVPVVKFIIKSIDEILKRDFDLAKGLADTNKIVKEFEVGQKVHVRNPVTGRMEFTNVQKKEFHRVQVLDPAVGTATFLNEIIKYIYQGFEGQKGRWPAYVQEDLLPRLHGFELMMAPYTIAHLKLGMTLQETGVEEFKQRLGVYLTNTLEEGTKQQQDLFSFGLAEAVSHEAAEAAIIKHEKPIMVVVGNPPYSGHSSNKTDFAKDLVQKYIRGIEGLNKPAQAKWLSDDYVKFISFGEEMIAKNTEGILAFVTNHGYIDNPTFRGMRKHLLTTFSKIYILDLHGNVKKNEKAPNGAKDENVFDIQQGVSILIGVKSQALNQKGAEIFHADLYGKRQAKYKTLNESSVLNVEWEKVQHKEPTYLYINKNEALRNQYDTFISIADLFSNNGTPAPGIVTTHDEFAISWDKNDMIRKVQNLLETDNEGQARQLYKLCKQNQWNYEHAKSSLQTGEWHQQVTQIDYRPFDKRWTVYNSHISVHRRERVNKHFYNQNNVGMMVTRQQKTDGFQHALVHSNIVESSYVSNRTSEIGYSFPLWIYSNGQKISNLSSVSLQKFTVNLKQHVTPQDVFDYSYAAIHSPSYREKFKEVLKEDFPKIPIPKSDTEFKKLTAFGKQLREVHLMTSPELDNLITTYPVAGTDEVDKIRYEDNKVWINDTQYFGNVPEVAWNFYIGGYQPAQKWLKDRKGRKLTNQDIEHYQKIIKILVETDKLMQKIDKFLQP